MDKVSNLIWIDLEMTGLDPEQDRIVEIATLITDPQLTILAEGPVLAIHQSNSVLSKMDAWCTKTHGESGLTERVKQSNVDEKQAEAETLKFIKKYSDSKSSPLCGNSVWQDRRFLYRHMATLESYFHYRIIDVSTLKELARRWKPEILEKVQKKDTHRALDDIKESIEELRIYQKHFFKL